MASIEEFNKKIDQVIANLPKFIKQTSDDIALNDLAALISERVINKGENEKGGSFSGYSTKATLAGASTFTSKAAFNKVAGSKAKRKSLDWVTLNGNSLFVLKGGYKEVRKLEGREVGHKSFERTGKMWQNFGIVRTQQLDKRYIVSLGGLNKDAQDKMNWNSEEEGTNILGATKEEQNIIAQLYEKRLVNYLKKNL